MQYVWSILGVVFLVFVFYTYATTGVWNEVNALWALVCFFGSDIAELRKKLEEK